MPRILLPLLSVLMIAASSARAADPQPVTPDDWGITLNLPANGDIGMPGDEGMEDSDLDFLWMVVSDNPLEDPVYQIDGSTIEGDEPEAPMTPEAFDAFYPQMVQDLGADEKFTVLSSIEDEQHGGRRWQVFDLQEVQTGTDEEGNATERVISYLSYFALDGEELRLVNFYYEPNEDGTAPPAVAQIVSAVLGA